MKNFWYALLCLVPFAAGADNDISKVNRAIRVEAGQRVGDVESVNGSIQIDDGALAQDVNTVNGSITLGDRTTVKKVNTVNGGIRIGEQAQADEVETVNGTLRIGAGTQIAAGVSAVNGSISLAKDASVSGRVENVNGKIALEVAHVGGGIQTTNGDIDIGAGSRVEGGILVEKPRGRNWFGGERRPPTVVIGPGAIVAGELRFEQPVELYVSTSAKVGQVTGAKPVAFPGEQPSAHLAVEK